MYRALRHASTTTFTFSATTGMNNATFATALCAALEGASDTPLLILSISGMDLFLELPECVWADYGLYSSDLTTVALSNLLVRGNSSGTSSQVGPSSSNPLMRLSTSITSLNIRDCTLVDPTTTTYAPSWQAFVERMTQLTNLQVFNSATGGTVITAIPAQLRSLTISNSGLTGSISSSLLSLLSESLVSINLALNQLTGTIPADLFTNYAGASSCTAGTFHFNDNKLTGSIPDSLLSSGGICTDSFELLLGNNLLTGSLPSSLCSSCPSKIHLDLTQNQLSGTISPSILDAWFAKGVSGLSFVVSNNSFTGAVPGIFANLPEVISKRATLAQLSSSFLDFSYNKFDSAGLNVVTNTSVYVQGDQTLNLAFNEISSLPDHFLDSYTGALTVDLTGNKITTLPAGFLHGITFSDPYTASVSLGQNLLTSLPEDLFNSSLGFQSLTFNVSNNPTLTSSLPSGLTSLAASSIEIYDLDFSHCGFTGAIPNMPFANRVWNMRFSFASNHLNNGSSGIRLSSFIGSANVAGITGFILDISDNAFVGALDVTQLSSLMRDALSDESGFYLNASGNSFTALAYDDNWASATYSLDISRNTLMTSAIFPESLFNDSSHIRTLYASKTGITGVFPILTNADLLQLYELDFSGSSGIDFCSGNRTAWTTNDLSICKLYLTTAANCSDLYPSNCEFSAPPEAPPVEIPVGSPSAEPSTPATPSSTPAAPETPSSAPGAPETPSSAPVAPETPSFTPIRPPTGAASAISASLVVIGFSALIALVASV